MRLGTAILALAAAVWLGGCAPKKPQTVQAAPPPPKPPAPAKAPEPLSIPQTSVELPKPQPIPADALAPPETGAPPTPAPPPARPSTRSQRPQTQPGRTEPATPVGPPTPPTPAPAVEPRPPIGEALPAPEAKRLQDEAHARMQEARQLIGRISARRLNQQKSIYTRITSFLTQAEEAEQRGDMRQASELAGRAAVLARELRP